MSIPREPATGPAVLPAEGTDLWEQVQAYLAADTGPLGIVSALGNGALSIYPNNETDGPSADRAVCPTPFLVVYDMGVKATDPVGRDVKVGVEVYDDTDHGEVRLRGLLLRVKQWLCGGRGCPNWVPTSDDLFMYRTGLRMEEQSALLPATDYDCTMRQVLFSCRATDSTSSRGQQG